MNEETIKSELQKYQVTDAAISKLRQEYMVLTVKDVSDSAGYETVKAARIDIKKRRVEVEKTRVTLKAESLEYGRRVDGEAKRITALLEPIENYLTGQEKIVDDEKARIKAEAEAKEAAIIQGRRDRLAGIGISFNGQMWSFQELNLPEAMLKTASDDQFNLFFGKFQEKKGAEDAKRLAEEADHREAEEEARKAESDRLAKVAAEQQAESIRLAEISQKQTEEAERIKNEQKKIDDAKQKVIDDALRAEQEKARKEEIERVKAAAIEEGARQAERKAQEEKDLRAKMEEKVRIAAEKKAARLPDKEKLLALADTIASICDPEMKTDKGKDILLDFNTELDSAINNLRGKAAAL
jgi:hypothetical protein